MLREDKENSYKTYTIPGGKYGTDDLKSIYAFYGNSQGDESRSNDIEEYKRQDDWWDINSWFKDIDTTNQKELDRRSKKLAIENELYIRELKKIIEK